jgi:hypothetical protein
MCLAGDYASDRLKKNHFDSLPKWLYQRRMEEISRRPFAVSASLIKFNHYVGTAVIDKYQYN